MNYVYAKTLIITVLLSIGAFNIMKGISNIKARNESTIFGWMRITLGLLLVLIPIPLLYFLRSGET